MDVTIGPTDVLHVPQKEAREEAMRLLKRVGVENQTNKVPAQLSGDPKSQKLPGFHPKRLIRIGG